MDRVGSAGAEALRLRARKFAHRVLAAFRALDRSAESRILGGQMLRAGTSVAANYRAACRARSRREFIAKLGVVAEESDETQFWLEFFAEAGMLNTQKVAPLVDEAGQLTAIFSASLHTARTRTKSPKPQIQITRSPDSPITR